MQNVTIQNVQSRLISCSQALRIKRICSDESEYQYNSEKLMSKLIEHGYKVIQ